MVFSIAKWFSTKEGVIIPSLILFNLYLFSSNDFFYNYFGFDYLLFFLLALLLYQRNSCSINQTSIPINYNTVAYLLIFILSQFYISKMKSDMFFFLQYLLALYLIYISWNNKKLPIKLIFFVSFIHSTIALINFYVVDQNIKILLPILYVKGNTVNGFLHQQNISALFINTGFLLTIYFYNLTKSYKEKKLLFFLSIYFMYIGILTSSRASSLGIILAILIMIYINHKKNIDYCYLLFILAIYPVIFAIVQYTSHTYILTKFQLYKEVKSYSIDSRLNIWVAQILMFLDKPIFGWGLENFKYNNYLYQIEALKITKVSIENILNFTYGHNEFLQLLVEGGLFLFFPLVVILYQTLKMSVVNIRKYDIPIFGIIILYLVQFCFEWEFRFPLTGAIFVIMLSKLNIRNRKLIQSNSILTKIDYIPKILLLSSAIYLFPVLSYEYFLISKNLNNNNYEYLLKIDFPGFEYNAKEQYILKNQKKIISEIFGKKLVLSKSAITPEVYYKVTNFKDKDLLHNLIKINKEQLSVNNIWFYYTTLGLWHMLLKDYSEAKKYYLHAIKLKPDSDYAFFLLGINSRLYFSKNYNEFYSLLPDEKIIKKLLENFVFDDKK